MKKCKKCRCIKPFEQFYVQKGNSDGLFGACKDCVKRRVRLYRARNIESVRQHDRQRNKSPHRLEKRRQYAKTKAGKASMARQQERQRKLYPEKYAARTLLGNAIRDGKITRMPCAVCGNPKSEGHHPDYYKPLDVIWLCDLHHTETHTNNSK